MLSFALVVLVRIRWHAIGQQKTVLCIQNKKMDDATYQIACHSTHKFSYNSTFWLVADIGQPHVSIYKQKNFQGNWYYFWRDMLPWQIFLVLLSWCPIFNQDIVTLYQLNCYISFENEVPAGIIYRYPFLKCVAETWVGTRLVIPVMSTRVACRIDQTCGSNGVLHSEIFLS